MEMGSNISTFSKELKLSNNNLQAIVSFFKILLFHITINFTSIIRDFKKDIQSLWLWHPGIYR